MNRYNIGDRPAWAANDGITTITNKAYIHLLRDTPVKPSFVPSELKRVAVRGFSLGRPGGGYPEASEWGLLIDSDRFGQEPEG